MDGSPRHAPEADDRPPPGVSREQWEAHRRALEWADRHIAYVPPPEEPVRNPPIGRNEKWETL